MTEQTEAVVIDNSDLGIVLYSDGSCRPNPGKIGWGVHGYMYTKDVSKKGPGLSTHILTDSGYVPNTKANKELFKAVTPIKYFDFFGSSRILGSNNLAEVEAITNGLEAVSKYDVKQISIFTDSEYLRRGLTEWSKVWVSRNWIKTDGTPIPNADTWKRLLKIVETIKQKGIRITIEWVKAHSDIFGNIHADYLATLASNYSNSDTVRVELKTTESDQYWKSKVEKHPLLYYKNMLFNSVKELNEVGKYYLYKYETDEPIGKKNKDSAFSIILLKNPDVILEMVKQKQFNISNEINSIVIAKLDRIYNSEIYGYLDEYQDMSLLPNKNRLDLNFLDDKPITVELNPPGKSIKAIEDLTYIEEMLNYYKIAEVLKSDNVTFDKDLKEKHETTINNLGLIVHDITLDIYDSIPKPLPKSKAKKVMLDGVEVKPNTRLLLVNVDNQVDGIYKANVQETELKIKKDFMNKDTLDLLVNIMSSGIERTITIPLILGVDLPNRNVLKNIEESIKNIKLITWKESEKCFKYAVIINTVDAVGIYCNLYSNSVLIK